MLSLIGGREEYRWHISMWNKYNAYPKTERKRSEREIKRDGERANDRAKKRKKSKIEGKNAKGNTFGVLNSLCFEIVLIQRKKSNNSN